LSLSSQKPSAGAEIVPRIQHYQIDNPLERNWQVILPPGLVIVGFGGPKTAKSRQTLRSAGFFDEAPSIHLRHPRT
jgi:hypothetical protein